MKNSIYFIVIALLAAELFKILIHPNKELILFIIYFFFVRLFLHIIIYYDNCFNYYVLPTLFLLVNTFLLILHVFNIAFIVISSIFIKRLKNTFSHIITIILVLMF